VTVTVKAKVRWGTCSMFVEGIDMNCPLCGKLVESGKTHYCETAPPKAKSEKPKASSK
jgi:hypothetical protein